MLSQPARFMECIIRFLMPHFIAITADAATARTEILETLASYSARTYAEMLDAAQAIAFGLAALETLQQANIPKLSPAMRRRYRDCAKNLNRSCQLSEMALTGQLRRDLPRRSEPAGGVPEATIGGINRETAAGIYRSSLPGTASRALAAAPSERDLWAGAMAKVLAEVERSILVPGVPILIPVPGVPILIPAQTRPNRAQGVKEPPSA